MRATCSAPASLLLRISIAGARVRVRIRIRIKIRAKVRVKPASVVYVRVRAKIRVTPAGFCIKGRRRRDGVVGLVEGLLLLDLLLHLLRVCVCERETGREEERKIIVRSERKRER